RQSRTRLDRPPSSDDGVFVAASSVAGQSSMPAAALALASSLAFGAFPAGPPNVGSDRSADGAAQPERIIPASTAAATRLTPSPAW
ncbi:MAG: hypothetical protein ACXWYG_04180, partial [Aeromicrobium sp.]